MNLYLLGMIFFLLVFIVSIFLLIYFIKDEKSLKEVTNQELIKLGKIYTKEEFENNGFNVECDLTGLGEIKEIQDMYAEHLRNVWGQ